MILVEDIRCVDMEKQQHELEKADAPIEKAFPDFGPEWLEGNEINHYNFTLVYS